MDLRTYKYTPPVEANKVDSAILGLDAALEKMRADGKTDSPTYKTYSDMQRALLGYAQMAATIEQLASQLTYAKNEIAFLKQYNASLAQELNVYTVLSVADANDTLNEYLRRLRAVKKELDEVKTKFGS